MAMRITSLYSGLDTESIISQLVEVKSTKLNTAKKEQTKLGWKQDAWKTLNTKILNLYDNFLSNMRLESTYTKKTTTASNTSAVSVLTGANAVNSVQNLKINNMAKIAYLTSGKTSTESGESVTSSTRLSDMGLKEGDTVELTVGSESGSTVKFTVGTDGSTVSDMVSWMKNNGVSASFDKNSQRFFISGTESGDTGNFEINMKTTNDDGDEITNNDALNYFGLNTSVDGSGKTIYGSDGVYITGKDASITLNGVTFTSNNNNFQINGLTITLNAESDEDITLTTADDTKGIYDMIKGFFKEYNTLIAEMDKLYNANSAKSYEPLTDEEKKAMSETEIEEWENKIKDSLFRRDTSLGTVSGALKEIMSFGVMVNGKKMYLSDFGIETLGYFSSENNERNVYHIDGDADDSKTSGNQDKLLAMITNDPKTVVDFFTNLSKSMYDKMFDLMKGTDFSSSFTMYDDKKMKVEYADYTTKIAELEKKLTAYEDKWYAKFSAMEVALSKLQSNSNAITNLLGGGS